jgi:hypothetical protein
LALQGFYASPYGGVHNWRTLSDLNVDTSEEDNAKRGDIFNYFRCFHFHFHPHFHYRDPPLPTTTTSHDPLTHHPPCVTHDSASECRHVRWRSTH